MSFQPLSRLCVQRLTGLLELNCLEGFQHLEDSPFVAKNIEIEDQLPYNNVDPKNSSDHKIKSSKYQVKKLFRGVSKKGNFIHFLYLPIIYILLQVYTLFKI